MRRAKNTVVVLQLAAAGLLALSLWQIAVDKHGNAGALAAAAGGVASASVVTGSCRGCKAGKAGKAGKA